MTTIKVPVTLDVDVEFDFPEGDRFSMPGFHMEYATIDQEESAVDKINVSAVMPSVYWFHLRRAPDPFADEPYRITPQVNFNDALVGIINQWDTLMEQAIMRLKDENPATILKETNDE